MSGPLTDRVALVTGAASGIGRASAIAPGLTATAMTAPAFDEESMKRAGEDVLGMGAEGSRRRSHLRGRAAGS